jgi:hypothetical protein
MALNAICPQTASTSNVRQAGEGPLSLCILVRVSIPMNAIQKAFHYEQGKDEVGELVNKFRLNNP